ncbi:N-acetylmuramoyl-L-alanine amidase [Helicobacter trogontum]|uniref:N-acetylmuramoyl-L-alanine amidase n=1 Tax=Helicobacter trogontum TaxID=50960 RepID=A0A4U8S3H1_9HELI|nr:N-acetylmuramoyl-L-alanine amidase [Helicobacter trogontum]TLD80288.1 hypothetical protein LS81_009700 [Helicobacter trogontum]
MPNDNTPFNQDTKPLIDNQTILFTSLSGYLAFSGNLAVEVTENILKQPTKYLSWGIDIHNGVVSGITKSTSANDMKRIGATLAMEISAQKAGGIIGGGIQVAKQSGIRAGGDFIAKQSAKTLAKVGINVLGRIVIGAGTGAAFGSSIPIAGTIAGAVVGAVVMGLFSDTAYDYLSGESARKKEAEEAKIAEEKKAEELEKIYTIKIHQINDYVIRKKLVQKRYLTEEEYKILTEYLTNPNISYFKVILFYLSCPNLADVYIDKETNMKQLQIKPIADSIPLTIEIEKCHNGISGNLLGNTTIYIYNHRFKRVVAKGKSDNNGKLIVHNVYVGKEDIVDKLSFITDRDNFDESNFELSLSQYESFTNIQKKHKSTKELKLLQAYFSFNGSKLSLEYEYEVSNLKANIYKDTIELIPTHNLKDTRFRQYIKYAYMVFDITDSNIDEKTSNITIANRAMLGLKNLGNSGNNKYEIRESWREKIVIFFAYFDKQEKTPFFKALFIHKPIVILDLGNSGAIPLEYEQNSMKRVDIVYDIIQMIEARLKNIATLIKLQKNSDEIIGLDERVRKVNAIKQNTQSKNLLFLSLHIDSEATKSASGMRCFYNDKAYAEQEKRFIKHLKEIYPVTNNTYFENKSNLYLTKFVNVASVLVTLGFISNDDDKARLNNKTQRKAIANKLFLAISNYLRKNNK